MPHPEFQNGVYRTPAGASWWLGRAFPGTIFYPQLAWVIWKGGRLANRGRYGDDQWIESSRQVFHALEGVGCRFDIEGIDRIERLAGPVVFVGNHMSTMETAVLPSIIHPIRRITFVVKSKLLTYPSFGPLLKTRLPIALDQQNPREDLKKTLVEGAERLERGISVVVFPQGARRTGFDPEDFNTIGVKLAHRVGVPVVPLALDTSAWAVGKRIPDIGVLDPSRTVRFSFGEPLTASGRGVEEQRAVIDYIRGKLAQWESCHPATPSLSASASPAVAS